MLNKCIFDDFDLMLLSSLWYLDSDCIKKKGRKKNKEEREKQRERERKRW